MFCCATAWAQPGKPQQEAKPGVPASSTAKQTSAAGVGVISESVYRNDYFGLRINIPSGWTIQGDDTKQRIKEGGKALMVPKDETDKNEQEAAVERTLNLLSISKFPLGTPGQSNALFMAIAEPVPLSASGPDYMKQLKSAMEQTKVPVTFVDDNQVETINGVQFYRLTVTLTPGENLVRQRYYVIIKKGYALGLITTITSDSDNDTVNSILRSVTVQLKTEDRSEQ
jgi:hypothetical protein